VTYLPASRGLYVGYREVEEGSSALVSAIRTAMRRHSVDRLVLDLRANGGGEAGGYRELLRFLSSAGVNRPGGLIVLVGRLTFSAGASLTVGLERRAHHAVLMGEDTGGAPSFWADPTLITLPNSGIRALVATRLFGDESDPRLTIEPDVRVPFAAADYFGGRDPVLAAALSYDPSS
jgi:C-terminal processing protease CtpA/Prc